MRQITSREHSSEDVLRSSALNSIVASRMLVFRSKLLILNSVQSRFDRTRNDSDLEAVQRARAQLHGAETNFSATEVRRPALGATDWVWIYRSLIDVARTTMAKLRERHGKREGAQKFELATDLQMLEELIERWSQAVEEEEAAG